MAAGWWLWGRARSSLRGASAPKVKHLREQSCAKGSVRAQSDKWGPSGKKHRVFPVSNIKYLLQWKALNIFWSSPSHSPKRWSPLGPRQADRPPSVREGAILLKISLFPLSFTF